MIIAGVLGGIVMFLWSGLAHEVLRIGGESTIRGLNDPGVIATIQQATGDQSGIYLFPSNTLQPAPRMGPAGFLAYSASGMALTPSVLAEEALLEIAQALIAAVLLSLTVLVGYWRRAGFVALVGLAVAIGTSASYAIFFKFPADYTAGYIATDIIRYILAGLTIAAILRRPAAA